MITLILDKDMAFLKFYFGVFLIIQSYAFGNELTLLKNSYLLLNKMHETIGLTNHVKVFISSDVKIAKSEYFKNQNYILINPYFYSDSTISFNQRNQILAGILAHEMGHIISGHNHNESSSPEEEKEADYFCGYMLAQLGFNEETAQAPLQYFLSVMDTNTHGSVNERIKNMNIAYHRTPCTSTKNITFHPLDPQMEYHFELHNTYENYFIYEKNIFIINLNGTILPLGKINKKSQMITLDKESFLVDLHQLKVWLVTLYDGYIYAGKIHTQI